MTHLNLPFESAFSDGLTLRKAVVTDNDAYLELYSDPHVRRYLGGAVPEERIQARLDAHGIASITSDPGAFVIADNPSGEMVGMVVLERRSLSRPGHVAKAGNELELSYMLRRRWWGQGLAFQAASLLLDAASAHLPDQLVVAVTQTSNTPSVTLAERLGFEHATTFIEFGAQQWLGVRRLHRLGTVS